MNDARSDPEAKILAAVVGLLVENGVAGVTTDSVAARAGVSKQTIYRRWPTKAQLVVGAVRSLIENLETPPDTGSLRGDLTRVLRTMRTQVIDNNQLSVGALLSATRRVDPDLDAALAALSDERRQPVVDVLHRAVRRGDLASGADVDTLADAAIGALFLRYLFRSMPVDDDAIDAVVAVVSRASTS